MQGIHPIPVPGHSISVREMHKSLNSLYKIVKLIVPRGTLNFSQYYTTSRKHWDCWQLWSKVKFHDHIFKQLRENLFWYFIIEDLFTIFYLFIISYFLYIYTSTIDLSINWYIDRLIEINRNSDKQIWIGLLYLIISQTMKIDREIDL